MATRCTAEQLAEAVTIWSVDINFRLFRFQEVEDTAELKPLDLLLSTVKVVLSAFNKHLETERDEHKRQIVLSKQNFIHYLKARCLLLSENNGCFNLALMLAFFSNEIWAVSFYHECFHLARDACKLLKNILEDKFAEMFNTDSEWEGLMSYCKKIHAAVYPSKVNRPLGYDTDEGEFIPRHPNMKYGIFFKEPSSNEQLNKNGSIQQEGLDSSDRDNNSKQLLRESIDEMSGNKLIHSSDIANASVEKTKKDSHLCESEIVRGRVSHEGIEDTRKSLEDASLQQERPEFTSTEHDAKSIGPTVIDEIVDEKTTDSPVIEESSDDESLADDAVYWNYEMMRCVSLRKRITDNRQHLEDALKLLAKIKGKIATESLPSNKYDIPISGNEDIEALEKCVTKPNYSEGQICLSEESVENIKKEICAKRTEKLGNSSSNLVRPEDITDGEVFQNVISIFGPSDDDDDDYCKLCAGKMRSFKTKWTESFHEKYPGKVSDFL